MESSSIFIPLLVKPNPGVGLRCICPHPPGNKKRIIANIVKKKFILLLLIKD